MEPRRASSRARISEPTMRMAVGALGVFHVILGGWQLFFPASFFDKIGPYGLENTHYVGDLGSFTLAFGIALLLAVGRPTWRAPILAVGALWYGIHAVNHLFDIDEARSSARGWADVVLIGFGAALLAWLASAAEKLSRDPGGGGVASPPSGDRAEQRESERRARAARRRD